MPHSHTVCAPSPRCTAESVHRAWLQASRVSGSAVVPHLAEREFGKGGRLYSAPWAHAQELLQKLLAPPHTFSHHLAPSHTFSHSPIRSTFSHLLNPSQELLQKQTEKALREERILRREESTARLAATAALAELQAEAETLRQRCEEAEGRRGAATDESSRRAFALEEALASAAAEHEEHVRCPPPSHLLSPHPLTCPK